MLLRAGILLLFALAARPQEPVIRVDVNLRQVDLILTDAKGNHISDLRASDFELLEDGRPQPITNFSWVEVTPPPSGARLAALKEKPSLLEWYSGVARLRKTPGNDGLSSPVANLKREEIRRMIAVVAQDENAATRIRKFIDEQTGDGDMISIRSTERNAFPIGDGTQLRLRDSMGIFEQFTNDKRQLDAATERLKRVCFGKMCVNDTPGGFRAAIGSLRDLPGRKALLFVGRYKGPVDDIIREANRAGVVIYLLDDAGVDTTKELVDEMVAPESERVLAEKTGGRLLLSTVGFDLTSSFNEVIEDLSGYYLLGFRPDADDSKTPRHKIEVKVLRPGLKARFRDGLMGAPDPEARPAAAPAGREQILTQALFSPFTQDGIRIHLEPTFGASNQNAKKKRTPVVRVLLDIDGRDLSFTDTQDGKKQTVVDVAVAVFDGDATQAGAANQAFTILVSKEKAAQIGKGSLQYPLDVPLKNAGPYQVRAAVRDATSGELGSAYAFLDIPDFNRPKISLSSLVLSLPQGSAPAPGTRPEWNEFAPGAEVNYICEVFGLKTPGKPPAPPEVATEIKLYRGGGPVADVPLSPVKLESRGGQLFLTGSLRIPADLASGNYTAEVLAQDRLDSSKKSQPAQQWIDLAIVNPQSANPQN